MWNTLPVCLSYSAESVGQAIFIALHSVSHAFKEILPFRGIVNVHENSKVNNNNDEKCKECCWNRVVS